MVLEVISRSGNSVMPGKNLAKDFFDLRIVRAISPLPVRRVSTFKRLLTIDFIMALMHLLKDSHPISVDDNIRSFFFFLFFFVSSSFSSGYY